MALNAPNITVGAAGGAQKTYRQDLLIAGPGQLADLSNKRVITGINETDARMPYGIPVVLNPSGDEENSMMPMVAAGSMMGILMRSEAYAKASYQAATPYEDGVPPGFGGNVLTQGSIYLECVENVGKADALRYYKSGANAGKWGTTASAGNSLALAAGNWVIRRAGTASQPLVLEINSPAALTFTADA